MNRATDTTEHEAAVRTMIMEMIWDGSEVLDCEVYRKCGHRDISESVADRVIDEMLDEGVIVATLIANPVTPGSILAGFRDAHPLTAAQRREQLDAHARAAAKRWHEEGHGKCEAFERELKIDRIRSVRA